ncbi:MAG: hypothetical protein ABGW74_09400 [Campylobacterales bacterium]
MQASFTKAKDKFDKLYSKYNKHLYKLYSDRCKELKDKNITNFDGVFKFTTK